MSISGVQDKVSMRLVRGKLTVADRDGEFILKPRPSLELPGFREDVPANEHLTMLIAERVFGIETAACACVRLRDGELAFITRRFDRRDGKKVPQEDFCQLLQRSSDTHGKQYKYEGSYEELGKALRDFCPAYTVEVEKLYRRILFDYAFSNGDAHLKNFSLYQSAAEFGDYVLTPAYDLVCTSLHIPEESRLALDLFADDFETRAFADRGFYTGLCFLHLGERLGIDPERARRILDPFRSEQRAVKDLIKQSFLSDRAREDYAERYADRLKALNAGL